MRCRDLQTSYANASRCDSKGETLNQQGNYNIAQLLLLGPNTATLASYHGREIFERVVVATRVGSRFVPTFVCTSASHSQALHVIPLGSGVDKRYQSKK